MTEIELVGYLGIDQSDLKKIKKINGGYKIRDAKIGEIDSELWNQNVELRFFNCEFQETINLQGKKIQVQLFCRDCLFQGLFLARGAIFQSPLVFRACNFAKMVNFSNATFQNQVNFSIVRFKNEARLIETQFLVEPKSSFENKESEKNINNFKESVFEGEAIFCNATINSKIDFEMSQFKNNVDFSGISFNEIVLKDVVFEASSDWTKTTFENEQKFDSIYFGEEALFVEAKFHRNVSFANVIFNEVDFSEAHFCKDIEFDGVVFKDLTNFYKTKFKQKTSFEGSIFNGITSFDEISFLDKPNFLHCTFGNQFNISHQFLAYSFEDIKFETQQNKSFIDIVEYGFSKWKDDESENKDKKLFIQLFAYPEINQMRKDPLIWRDYFRRLKSNRLAYHNLIDASELHTQELYARELELKAKKPKGFSREWIEKWQLWFYRITSDHHTDLLKAWHTLLILIFSFLLCNVIVFYGFDHLYNVNMFSLFDLHSLPKFYDIHIQHIVLTNQIYALLSGIACIAMFLILFILMISCLRKLCVIPSYFSVLFVLCVSPKMLIPVIGIFTDKRGILDPLATFGGIYTIIFGFILYSFLKTARKNSIVPN